MASLTTRRLHGAATQSASPLGPGRALTLPCGWNNAGRAGKLEILKYLSASGHSLSRSSSRRRSTSAGAESVARWCFYHLRIYDNCLELLLPERARQLHAACAQTLAGKVEVSTRILG